MRLREMALCLTVAALDAKPTMSALPSIPSKRYFTIGEVAELCGVKPHVLRYWEQEFEQLKPIKRRGNRRYYQHHEVEMVRRIRELLYEHGYTISGARNQLLHHLPCSPQTEDWQGLHLAPADEHSTQAAMSTESTAPNTPAIDGSSIVRLRQELNAIRQLLMA